MYEVINGFQIATMVLMVLFSVAMIVVVVLQEGSNANLGAITGAAESFFGKNKAKTLEAKFKRWTMIIGGCILICSIAYFVLSILKNNIPS
ncbi:MAG: preprotein translocase subunit SecG [Christensenellaceae bacterium]|jgi:preprotein translocase subunit SecG|nr:preprotein translocase subunit SecG [Christensenellaceae bacterium]